MPVLAVLTFLLAQDAPAPVPGVDEYKVQQAIQKGVEFLRTAASPAAREGFRNSDALILWTFVHAGVPQDDPRFRQLLQSVLAEPLERTYVVALLAMGLEEIDRVKYQEKIAHCAQFLVDNQCQNGQWSYGIPTESLRGVKVPAPPEATGPERGKGPGRKPKVVQHVAVRKLKDGPPTGDNSNSQYAALGLRACFDAGIELPERVILLAVRGWRETQFPDRKRDKEGRPVKAPPVPSGVTGKVAGWNYLADATDERGPYAAMTAGGVGSLILFDYLLGRDWRRDPGVRTGFTWLAAHYEIRAWSPYCLYAVERAGLLFGTEKIGVHEWYRDGANHLLQTQQAEGSWGRDSDWENRTWDTCFSILFLRRATRPLVATESSGKLKK